MELERLLFSARVQTLVAAPEVRSAGAGGGGGLLLLLHNTALYLSLSPTLTVVRRREINCTQ